LSDAKPGDTLPCRRTLPLPDFASLNPGYGLEIHKKLTGSTERSAGGRRTPGLAAFLVRN
jgi:hypothetical protein